MWPGERLMGNWGTQWLRDLSGHPGGIPVARKTPKASHRVTRKVPSGVENASGRDSVAKFVFNYGVRCRGKIASWGCKI